MTQITEEMLENILDLCALKCSQQEKEKLLNEMAIILTYVEKMNEISTENVLPSSHAIEDMYNVMRDDTPRLEFSSEDLLILDKIAGMLRVPSVIDKSS